MRWIPLTLVAVSTAAFASPTTREAVRSALEQPRVEPISGEGWRWLGDDVEVHLVATARDAKVPMQTRVRAVWALGATAGETAHKFFTHVATTEDVEAPVLAAVIETFPRAFRGPEALRVATEHLHHSEPVVRTAAARAVQALQKTVASR